MLIENEILIIIPKLNLWIEKMTSYRVQITFI